MQKGAGFVTDRSLAEIFHVITKHHCAVLLSKDTLERDYTLIQVFCLFRYFSWSVQGLVVPVSSAEPPTRRAFILRLLTFIFTLSVPRGGLGALRCCSSAVTCASSLARLCFPATSRLSSVELSLAPQAWHYAQCLHLTCARRKRSRDAFPTDSNSRRRS